MSTQQPIQRNEEKIAKQESSKGSATEHGTLQLDQTIINQARHDPTSLKPPEVQRLQRVVGNQAVGQILGKGGVIQRSPAQRAVTVTPEEKSQLSSKICFDAVAYALQLEGSITAAQYANWGKTNADALTKLVNENDTRATAPQIPADSVIGVFRRQTDGGPLMLSHVMLSLGGGLAIGSNNGCIGGDNDWSVQDLAVKLSWPSGGGTPSLGPTTDANAPGWARERVVCYRPVTNAVAQF